MQQAGFFTDPNAGTPSPSKGTKREGKEQWLLPVTVRQLHNAKQLHGEDVFKIDGKLEPSHVSIVGQIVLYQEQATSLNYEVADGTGSIDVKLWLDTQDKNEYNNAKRTEWREGAWVKVVGHLRSFGGVRNLVAFRIHVVDDFNEITFHQVQAAYAHLLHQRGPAAQGLLPIVSNPALPLQQQVQELVRACPDSDGATVQWLLANLPPGTAEQKVREAIAWLSNEGWVYTSVDDEHWRVGSNQ